MVSVVIGQTAKPNKMRNVDALEFKGEYGIARIISDNEHIICDISMNTGVRKLAFEHLRNEKENTMFIYDIFATIGHNGEQAA